MRCSSRVSTRSSPTTRPRRRPARRHSSSSVRHDHLNDIEDFCGALGSLSGMAVEGRGAAHSTRPSAGPRRAVCQVLVHRQPFPPEVSLDGVSIDLFVCVSLSVSLTRKVTHCSNWIDAAIGRVVDDLKTSGLYEETLICFNADNGGPLPTGNNWPLKGGKFSNCTPRFRHAIR